MTVQNFLLVFLVFFAIMTVLKYVRQPEKAIAMNSWYHILGENRHKYDFAELLKREKRFYPIATAVSAVGFLLASVGQELLAEMIVYLLFIIFMFSIYYLRPRKTNHKES